MILNLATFQTTEFLVPFLFSIAVIFGVLEITNIFRNRAVNLVIALTLSFFAMSNSYFVNLLWNYFGNIAMFFIVMFLIAFVFEIFGVRKKGQPSGPDSMIINGAVLFVLLSVGFMYTDMIPTIPFIGGGENVLLLVAVILVLAIFWTAYRLGSAPKGK